MGSVSKATRESVNGSSTRPTGPSRCVPNEAQWEKLNETLDEVPHLFKANAVWSISGIQNHGGVLLNLTRDWQLSSVATVQSGATYGIGYSYQSNGGNVNITGSPDWGGG